MADSDTTFFEEAPRVRSASRLTLIGTLVCVVLVTLTTCFVAIRNAPNANDTILALGVFAAPLMGGLGWVSATRNKGV